MKHQVPINGSAFGNVSAARTVDANDNTAATAAMSIFLTVSSPSLVLASYHLRTGTNYHSRPRCTDARSGLICYRCCLLRRTRGCRLMSLRDTHTEIA